MKIAIVTRLKRITLLIFSFFGAVVVIISQGRVRTGIYLIKAPKKRLVYECIFFLMAMKKIVAMRKVVRTTSLWALATPSIKNSGFKA